MRQFLSGAAFRQEQEWYKYIVQQMPHNDKQGDANIATSLVI